MEKEKKVVEGNNANPEPAGKEPTNQEQAPGLGQMPKEVPNPDKGSKGKDKKKAITPPIPARQHRTPPKRVLAR